MSVIPILCNWSCCTEKLGNQEITMLLCYSWKTVYWFGKDDFASYHLHNIYICNPGSELSIIYYMLQLCLLDVSPFNPLETHDCAWLSLVLPSVSVWSNLLFLVMSLLVESTEMYIDCDIFKQDKRLLILNLYQYGYSVTARECSNTKWEKKGNAAMIF